MEMSCCRLKQWCCCIFFLLGPLVTQLVVSSASEIKPTTKLPNPFTPKASLIRYWNIKIPNSIPPHLLLSKASPLNATDYAFFNKLASQHKLSSQLSNFCKSANLFCKFDLLDHHHHLNTSNFTSYTTNNNFTHYTSSVHGGLDSFTNYTSTGNINFPTNSFTHYTLNSTAHREVFTTYSDNANIGNDGFTQYSTGSNAGSSEFTHYESNVNIPNVVFTTYDTGTNTHKLSFTAYTPDANSGSERFMSYGRNGEGMELGFRQYGVMTNVMNSSFIGYSEMGNGGNNSFKGYGLNGNKPSNSFKRYGVGGKNGVDSFIRYRDGGNVGDDEFQVYGRDEEGVMKMRFENYGKSFNDGMDVFKEYGRSGDRRDVRFSSYGVNNSFKGYGDDQKGINFAGYASQQQQESANSNSTVMKMKNSHYMRWVEEGKFFRESMLEKGNRIRMPDITDKMPNRSFLPRSILSKLQPDKLNQIFNPNTNNSLTEQVIRNTLEECNRPPSKGETKRCVGSIEDMIDFTLSVLGNNTNLIVRTTQNVNGSSQKVKIGAVRDGKMRTSVSCHQSLFPYLMYYCHSVPKVKVYEVDIIRVRDLGDNDDDEEVIINHGVAICHMDTKEWSPGHDAFLVLGSKPGVIEVCHWIYENDMTWTANF